MFFRCLFPARRVGQCFQGCVQGRWHSRQVGSWSEDGGGDSGNGATELEQIFGWVDFKEAKIYTRAAPQTAGAATLDRSEHSMCSPQCRVSAPEGNSQGSQIRFFDAEALGDCTTYFLGGGNRELGNCTMHCRLQSVL
jgi:hypothetical protein